MNLQILIEMIGRLKPNYGVTITKDTLLNDLGLSSLEMMIMIYELEQTCSIEIQLNIFQNVRTVEQLYNVITKDKKGDESYV